MRFQFTLISFVASIASLVLAAPAPIVAVPALNRRASTIKTITPGVNPKLSGASGAVILPNVTISNSSVTSNPPPTGVNSTTNSTVPASSGIHPPSSMNSSLPHLSPASGGIANHHNSSGNGTIGKIGTTAHHLTSNSSSSSNSTSGKGDKKKAGKGDEKKKAGKGDEKKKEAEKKKKAKAEKKKEEEKKKHAKASSASSATVLPTGTGDSTTLPTATGDSNSTALPTGADSSALPTASADAVRRFARRALHDQLA